MTADPNDRKPKVAHVAGTCGAQAGLALHDRGTVWVRCSWPEGVPHTQHRYVDARATVKITYEWAA